MNRLGDKGNGVRNYTIEYFNFDDCESIRKRDYIDTEKCVPNYLKHKLPRLTFTIIFPAWCSDEASFLLIKHKLITSKCTSCWDLLCVGWYKSMEPQIVWEIPHMFDNLLVTAFFFNIRWRKQHKALVEAMEQSSLLLKRKSTQINWVFIIMGT